MVPGKVYSTLFDFVDVLRLHFWFSNWCLFAMFDIV